MQSKNEEQVNNESRKHSQRGAIIVEASISLTVFMFAIFTLLSLIQMAYVQSRMTVALSCATKEMAQYAHVFYVTEMDTALASSGGKSSELFKKVAELLQNVGGDLGTVSDELGQFVTETGNAIDGDSLGDMLKSAAGQAIIEQMMKSNLVTGTSDSAEDFMHRNRIENLDFMQSKILEGGTKDLFIRATYEIKVIHLLNLDYSFQMSTWAYAKAWGD